VRIPAPSWIVPESFPNIASSFTATWIFGNGGRTSFGHCRCYRGALLRMHIFLVHHFPLLSPRNGRSRKSALLKAPQVGIRPTLVRTRIGNTQGE